MTPAVPGARSRALADRLREAEAPNVTYLAKDFPVFWESAAGCTVTDVDGHTYLDTTGAFGVAAVGHTHPVVVEAVRAQCARLVHGMGDVHPPAVKVDLCERLRDAAPFPDGRVLLTGGGAEAVEAALKTAAITTGRPGIIAFEGAYHGLSYGALAVTHRADFREPWLSQLGAHVDFVPFPEGPDTAADALAALNALLQHGGRAGPIGAVVVEPIQGRAGVRVPPPTFLAAVARAAREHGSLFVADEIYTGLGRTGPFWACEAEDVVPDILVCGKALAGGLPIGACIGSPDAMAGWPPSHGEALHTSTFLGNPVICAAACATLTLLQAPDMARAVAERGAQLQEGLRKLADTHPCIGEVRGRGLMLGLELDSHPRCASAVTRGLQHGLILLGGGMDHNVLTLTPPFTVQPDEVDEMLRRLDATLTTCRT